MIEIKEISSGTNPPFDLLLSADPSIALVKEYLAIGKCFIAKLKETVVGTLVIIEVSPRQLEIKNIAVSEQFQGKGIGKKLLQFAINYGRKSGHKKLNICTGNSSIYQLALYQKMGFEFEGIKRNFFLENYSEPIFENGIQCKHLIVLSQELVQDYKN